MADRAQLEALFAEQGYQDYRWIDPQEIVVANWVRMKCMFGCGEYGNNASCPPNVPSVDACREFFREYRTAAVFHFAKRLVDPDSRHDWTREVNKELSKLERAVFVAGYPRAFLLFMDSCELCRDCTGDRDSCRQPRQSRPTPEAMAMDVFSTVRKIGYPIEVLPDTGQTMNRYAFLMVE
jgi:predicted metal-binding protein